MAFKRFGTAAALAATLMIGSGTFTEVAHAQVELNQVESVPKGAIGLGLVGAEIGLVLPAAIGLHETWAFIVFPLALGAGGAVGGYFAFDEPNVAEGGVAMLAIGMALIIPAVVLTLALTSYSGDDDEADDADGDDELDEEFDEAPSATPDDSAAQRDAHERAVAGAGLLHVGSRNLSLGVPGVVVRPSVTAAEAQAYGGGNTAEVHIPVVSGAF